MVEIIVREKKYLYHYDSLAWGLMKTIWMEQFLGRWDWRVWDWDLQLISLLGIFLRSLLSRILLFSLRVASIRRPTSQRYRPDVFASNVFRRKQCLDRNSRSESKSFVHVNSALSRGQPIYRFHCKRTRELFLSQLTRLGIERLNWYHYKRSWFANQFNLAGSDTKISERNSAGGSSGIVEYYSCWLRGGFFSGAAGNNIRIISER